MDNEEDCGHVIRVGDSVKEKGNLPKRTPLDVSQQKPFNIHKIIIGQTMGKVKKIRHLSAF